MIFGLVNRRGELTIPERIIKEIPRYNIYKNESIDWCNYYYIEIKEFDDFEELIEIFGKIAIGLDPSTNCHFLLKIDIDFDKKPKEDEVPF